MRPKGMKVKLNLILIIAFISFWGFNCTDNKYSKIENERILQGIIFSEGDGAVSCTTTPKFSDLSSSGLSSKCGGCHGSGSPKGGVDVSSYSSVSAKVSGSSPEGSIFYTAIKSGSMSSYSDSTLNNAVYCWIKGGASQ